MIYREQTTSDCWIEGTVCVVVEGEGVDAKVLEAELCYDPDPHGDVDARENRLVRFPIATSALGNAEIEHLIEQACDDFNAEHGNAR